jgi:hypothetical protein
MLCETWTPRYANNANPTSLLATRASKNATTCCNFLQNDLEVFRLRGREKEIIVAPGPACAFLVIVIQRWSPTMPDEFSALSSNAPAGSGAAAVASTGAGK